MPAAVREAISKEVVIQIANLDQRISGGGGRAGAGSAASWGQALRRSLWEQAGRAQRARLTWTKQRRFSSRCAVSFSRTPRCVPRWLRLLILPVIGLVFRFDYDSGGVWVSSSRMAGRFRYHVMITVLGLRTIDGVVRI